MYKWKPSKTAKQEFAEKMKEIETFCKEHGIYQSQSGDSYYFTLNGIDYRVSNHTVEKSNEKAFDEDTGEQVRELYHPNGRGEGVYIHASKTRIIEIYTDLKNSYVLDGKGNRKL